MHYSTLIVTTGKVTRTDIERILEPFEENKYYSEIEELREVLGDDFDEDNSYEYIKMPILMWDWYEIGGRWNNQILKQNYMCNSAQANTITNLDELSPVYCIDDTTGDVIVREYWNGRQFIADEDYDIKLSKIKERSKSNGYYLTMVDIHC